MTRRGEKREKVEVDGADGRYEVLSLQLQFIKSYK